MVDQPFHGDGFRLGICHRAHLDRHAGGPHAGGKSARAPDALVGSDTAPLKTSDARGRIAPDVARHSSLRNPGQSRIERRHPIRSTILWMRKLVLTFALVLSVAPLHAQQDGAADYPDRAVKIVVSVPAGGGVDTVTRIFAAALQQRFGQPFVIENRGGAGGNIAAESVFVAEPDGYTLLASQPAPITSNVALYKKLNFDPAALEPVAVLSKFPNVLLVRPDF